MNWAIFRKSLRDSRKALFGWGIGLSLYALLIASLYPSIAAESEKIQDLIDSYPAVIKDMVGGEFDMTTPTGFLSVEFFSWLPLLLGIFAILQGLSAITGEERHQSMDTLLALPVPRWRLLFEKFLATLAILVGILTQVFVTLVLSTQIWPEFKIGAGDLAAATYGSTLMVAVTAGMAYLLSAVLPLHRRWGGALATLFLVGSYLVYTLRNTNDIIKSLQPLTIFDYFDARAAMTSGLEFGSVLVLAAAALVLLLGSMMTFERRDVGV
jgi:ABC-2 type transport system permease protein